MSAPKAEVTVSVGPEFTGSIILADPQGQLLDEIADPAMHRADVITTYALAVRQKADIDWAAVNAAIIARWSLRSLEHIKRDDGYEWEPGDDE